MPFIGKLRLFGAMTLLLLVSCVPQAGAKLPCPLGTPSLQVVEIPDDACFPHTMTDFGNMAWQTFKYLVWPATGRDEANPRRGEADLSRKITDLKGSRVFETYKADWETFQKGAVAPLEWDKYPKKASICADADTTMPPLGIDSLVLASLHKFGNLDGVFGPLDAPLFHILVSQKGSLVRYLTGFGKQTFNTILNNRLYGPLSVSFSGDEPEPPRLFDPGSINIKSAWIEMDGFSESEKARFHTRTAWVQRPDHDAKKRTCGPKLVGLVALHIAHKTKSSPQWIWASFEHVQNVPDSGKPADGTRYTFNDGLGTAMKPAPPPEATFPLPNPFKTPTPFNVERQKVIPQEIEDINTAWQDVLKDTVWSNYKLVMVQWPRHKNSPSRNGADPPPVDATAVPMPPCGGFASNTSVANTVIESFLQLDTDCGMSKTCMSCHNLVRNYDFIWSIPTKDREPGKVGVSVLRKAISGQRQ